MVAKSICFLKILERLGWSKAFPAIENNASNKTNKKASDSNMCRLLLGFVDSCCLIVWEDTGRPCCPVVLPRRRCRCCRWDRMWCPGRSRRSYCRRRRGSLNHDGLPDILSISGKLGSGGVPQPGIAAGTGAPVVISRCQVGGDGGCRGDGRWGTGSNVVPGYRYRVWWYYR